MNRFKGKRVLITGSNGGIGHATAIRFGSEGAELALHARRAEKLESLQNELAQMGISPIIIESEIASEYKTQAIVDHAVAELGSIDILVNNAGRMAEYPFLE